MNTLRLNIETSAMKWGDDSNFSSLGSVYVLICIVNNVWEKYPKEMTGHQFQLSTNAKSL